MKTIIIFIVLLLTFLQYKLWFDNDGIPQVVRLQKEVNKQTTNNNLLRKRNTQLEAEVNDLKNGRLAIEERARNELGMIKDDEVFYQFIKK